MASAIDDAALGALPSPALAAHLTTCAGCAAKLAERRALAQRLDRALATAVRAEPPTGLVERITARVRTQRPQRPQRRRVAWFAVPAGLALAAGLLIVALSLGGSRDTPATDIGTVTAWRSPTASLLVSRTAVLGAPFELRSRHAGWERSRS